MDLELRGKVALVQGASKGIGRGIAESLAREGCDLVVTARGEEKLKEAAEAIASESGRKILYKPTDSASLPAMAELMEFIDKEFGRLDIIVCNSGGPPAGGVKDLKPEQWAEAANLLLAAPAYLLQLALPMLSKGGNGRFFIVTSSSTRVPVSGLTLSNSFRPGIVGFIKSLVEELAADHICCHSIAPGRFDTDRLKHLISVQAKKAGKSEDEIRRGMLDAIPAKRLGDPEDIGGLVAFLASPKASYLNGGNWMVDGGLVRSI
ncbi:SDR family oxidoreductase [soil metagenome]